MGSVWVNQKSLFLTWNLKSKAMITQENTVGIAIDKKTMKEFFSGKRDSITIGLDDETAPLFVEYIDGEFKGYILNVEETPLKYHGCYFHNNGVFPYVIKKSLENIMLVEGKTRIVGKIVSCTPEVDRRFRFGDKPGEPSVDDPNGDSCIWNLTFKLTPAE